ncbi:ester cyclase [Sorangium sp. So ce1504]|uniref:ester cyclase n=1 Tax=Sorangium sp. So ce1504 TaxID=3133337 RepID=UPI003F5D707E
MKGIHTLVERWANAWSSGSPDELLSLLSDDCIYEDVPTQHVTRGKQEIAAFARVAMRAFPDLRMEVTCSFATEEAAAAEWIGTGTHAGDFAGLPATSRRFRMRGASILVFRGDKLQRVSDYWDLASSGLLPGAPSGQTGSG